MSDYAGSWGALTLGQGVTVNEVTTKDGLVLRAFDYYWEDPAELNALERCYWLEDGQLTSNDGEVTEFTGDTLDAWCGECAGTGRFEIEPNVGFTCVACRGRGHVPVAFIGIDFEEES